MNNIWKIVLHDMELSRKSFLRTTLFQGSIFYNLSRADHALELLTTQTYVENNRQWKIWFLRIPLVDYVVKHFFIVLCFVHPKFTYFSDINWYSLSHIVLYSVFILVVTPSTLLNPVQAHTVKINNSPRTPEILQAASFTWLTSPF